MKQGDILVEIIDTIALANGQAETVTIEFDRLPDSATYKPFLVIGGRKTCSLGDVVERKDSGVWMRQNGTIIGTSVVQAATLLYVSSLRKV